MSKKLERKRFLAETIAEKITPDLSHEGQTALEATKYVRIRKALRRLPLDVLERLAK